MNHPVYVINYNKIKNYYNTTYNRFIKVYIFFIKLELIKKCGKHMAFFLYIYFYIYLASLI